MTIEIYEELVSTIADNVKIAQVDEKLIIVVDLETTIGSSSTGKMMGVASTGGFMALPVRTSRGKRIKMNLYIGEN